MATVRLSIKGIAKCYGLKRARVKKRMKKLGIKSCSGYKGFRLYSEEDAKAVGNYRRNRLLAKMKKEKTKNGLQHR